MKEDVFFCNDIEIEDELIKKKSSLFCTSAVASFFLIVICNIMTKKPVNNKVILKVLFIREKCDATFICSFCGWVLFP